MSEFEPEPENFEKGGSLEEAGTGASSAAELEKIKANVETEVGQAKEQGRQQVEDQLKRAEDALETKASDTMSENLNKMIPEGTEVTPDEIKNGMKELDNFGESAELDQPGAAKRLSDAVDKAAKGPNAEALNKMKTMTEGFAKKMGEMMENKMSEMDKDVVEQYKSQIKELQDRVESLKEKMDKGETPTDNDIKNMKDAADSAAKTAKESKAAEKAGAEDGKRAGKKVSMMGVLKLLLAFGGLFGLFFGLSWLADQITGCYKYTGDDGGVKIDDDLGCKDKPDATKCNCGNVNGINTQEGLEALCQNNATQHGYPWCCSNSDGTTPTGPTYPTCGGTPGDDGAVYYAFHKYTPASILAQLPNTLVNAAKGLGNIGTALLNQIIKWIGLALIILVSIAILYFAGQFILSKMAAPKAGFKTY